MNDLSNIILPKAILPCLNGGGCIKIVLCEMSTALARAAGLDKREVLSGIMARERLGSTAMQDGVAIPHAHLPHLKKPVGGFARLLNPVDFEAADGQLCDLVFMLLAPDNSGAEHLRALASVSRPLRQLDVRNRLRQARTQTDILAILAPEKAATAA